MLYRSKKGRSCLMICFQMSNTNQTHEFEIRFLLNLRKNKCTEIALSIETCNNGKSIKEKYDFYNNSNCFCSLLIFQCTIQDK